MRASGYERAGDDWYVEPRWAIDALLDVETFEGKSWDPSCGGGNIPTAMHERGLHCRATDIVHRGFGYPYSVDFLGWDPRDKPRPIANIVTNPPYGIIEPYIRQALLVATGKVAILARLALLEGMKRRKLFQETPLARVWVSSRRISMPPGGSDVPAKGGTVAYGWFVFEHGHVGPATIGWI